MEHDKTSRERRRLSKNFTAESEVHHHQQHHLQVERTPEYSFEKNPPKYLHNTSTPAKRVHSTTKNSNAKITTVITDRNREQNISQHHNDTDDEENTDEFTSTKQKSRRNSTSTEGTDENSSIDDNVKDKIEESPALLYKREKRRKKRQRQTENHRFSTTWQDNEENIDEDRNSMKLRRSAPGRRDHSDGLRRQRRNKERNQAGTDQRNELPITEILRKAQENTRTQYEEPVPLPELTTDKMYVQGKNGFSTVKITTTERNARRGHRDVNVETTIVYPIKIAILAQKAWKNAGLIYQGLLAGMALMHFLVIQTCFKNFNESIDNYSTVTEIYTNIFTFLVTMCIVSAFDKFDLAHFKFDHFRLICSSHAKAVLAIPLYITVFCLHQSTMKFDDKLALWNYNANKTMLLDNNSTMIITTEEIYTWRTLTLTKDSLVVVAWLFMSLGPQNDMLLTHLQAMERYAEDNPL